MTGSYSEYARGLAYLEGWAIPVTRSEWQLARTVLGSLHAAMIAAGFNTHNDAARRYRLAKEVFSKLDRPPLATPNTPMLRSDDTGTSPEKVEIDHG